MERFLSSSNCKLVLLGFFLFCHVIGFMCVAPDISFAGEFSLSSASPMTCPMGNATTCPASITASPQRQVEGVTLETVDHEILSFETSFPNMSPLVPALCPWSRVSSLVPFPVRSTSVLRI